MKPGNVEFNRVFTLLERILDITARTQEVIASDIANVDTPVACKFKGLNTRGVQWIGRVQERSDFQEVI